MKYNQIYAKIFRVVKHLTIYYVLTTFHSHNTPHFALFCQLCDIFNNLSAKYNPRKTPQNTANQRNKGGKTTMIKILFVCHGSILKNPGEANKINGFARRQGAYYTTTTPYQGTNFNRKIASKFEGLFGYLSPEMPPFQALSGILLIV